MSVPSLGAGRHANRARGNFYDTCKDCYIAGSSHLTCTCFNNVQDEYIGLVDLSELRAPSPYFHSLYPLSLPIVN